MLRWRMRGRLTTRGRGEKYVLLLHVRGYVIVWRKGKGRISSFLLLLLSSEKLKG